MGNTIRVHIKSKEILWHLNTWFNHVRKCKSHWPSAGRCYVCERASATDCLRTMAFRLDSSRFRKCHKHEKITADTSFPNEVILFKKRYRQRWRARWWLQLASLTGVQFLRVLLSISVKWCGPVTWLNLIPSSKSGFEHLKARTTQRKLSLKLLSLDCYKNVE